MSTLDQQRAAHALRHIDHLSGRSKSFKKSYRAYVDRLGPAIVMNGLGQALAMELAAAGPNPGNDHERAHRELYNGVQAWLCGEGVYGADGDLLRSIMNNDESLYRRAQAEALAWLEWHKKCCRASFPKGGEDEE